MQRRTQGLDLEQRRNDGVVGRDLNGTRERLDHGRLVPGLAAALSALGRGIHEIAAQMTAVQLVSVYVQEQLLGLERTRGRH